MSDANAPDGISPTSAGTGARRRPGGGSRAIKLSSILLLTAAVVSVVPDCAANRTGATPTAIKNATTRLARSVRIRIRERRDNRISAVPGIPPDCVVDAGQTVTNR